MTDRVTDDMIRDWRINYGLDGRTPGDAMQWWLENMHGAPAGAVAALGVCLIEIEALRAEVEQLKSGKLELARDMISIAHTDDEMEIVLDEQPIKVKFDFDAGEPQWFDARAGVGSPGYQASVEVYEIDFLDGKGWTQADQWPDQLDIERIEQLVMDCISDRNEYDADEYVEQLRESAMLADKWKR